MLHLGPNHYEPFLCLLVLLIPNFHVHLKILFVRQVPTNLMHTFFPYFNQIITSGSNDSFLKCSWRVCRSWLATKTTHIWTRCPTDWINTAFMSRKFYMIPMTWVLEYTISTCHINWGAQLTCGSPVKMDTSPSVEPQAKTKPNSAGANWTVLTEDRWPS